MQTTDIWVEKTDDGGFLLIFGDAKSGAATKSYDYRTFREAMLAYTVEVAKAASGRSK